MRSSVTSGLPIMRRLLTSGIKAILAVAALSTAAHWAMRVQRTPEAQPNAMASIPDPVTTGSIVPRKVEPARPPVAAPVETMTKGLDQQHLMKLFSTASEKPKTAAKAVAKR